MQIIYTKHLKSRAKQRKIPIKLVKEVLENAEEFYFDNLRSHSIVIAKINYKGKLRKMLVSYDKIRLQFEVITIHPISEKDINQKVESKRWINEKVKN